MPRTRSGAILDCRRDAPTPRPSTARRAPRRIERDIETLAGLEYTLSRTRRSVATPTRRSTAARSTTSTRELEATRVRRRRGPGRARSWRATDRQARRSSESARTATRTATAARYDGTMGVVTALEVCRLNVELGPRSAAAADLVPRGGGLGLRADAARQPDHAPACRTRTTCASTSARSTTVAASGSTPRRPATSRPAGASRSTCSTTSPAGSRCTSSRPASCRTPGTGSES